MKSHYLSFACCRRLAVGLGVYRRAAVLLWDWESTGVYHCIALRAFGVMVSALETARYYYHYYCTSHHQTAHDLWVLSVASLPLR